MVRHFLQVGNILRNRQGGDPYGSRLSVTMPSRILHTPSTTCVFNQGSHLGAPLFLHAFLHALSIFMSLQVHTVRLQPIWKLPCLQPREVPLCSSLGGWCHYVAPLGSQITRKQAGWPIWSPGQWLGELKDHGHGKESLKTDYCENIAQGCFH